MANQPGFLYRYRSLSDRSCEDVERTLAHRQIRFSSPEWFNDPFDCRVSETLDAPEEKKGNWLRERIQREIRSEIVSASGILAEDSPDLKEQVERKFEKLRPDVNNIAKSDLDELQRYLDNHGVLSLSERCDDILMWSHYADGHRGICLKFHSCALEFPIGALKPPPYRNAFHKPEEVGYSEPYPHTSLFDSRPWEMYRAWLKTKSRHWRYEGEWRVILPAGQPEGATAGSWRSPVQYKPAYGWHPLPVDALAGVIFGCKTSTENKRRVREWLRVGHVQVPVFEARKKSNRFELDIRPDPGDEGQ